jgi:hypothetical protein
MIVATRVLTLRRATGDVEIAIRIFAPEQQDVDWGCRFEIEWPDGMQALTAMGIDAVQALDHALKAIGANLYTSQHHKSGELVWLEPADGYGFPVANSVRDLLIGYDKTYM